MNNEKRVLLAVILSMAVLFLYPYFTERFFPQAVKKEAGEAKKEAPSQKPAIEAVPAVIVKPPAAQQLKEELITVDTPLYTATFTNIGAGVKSWKLKKYKETLDEKSNPVDIAGMIPVTGLKKDAPLLFTKTSIGGDPRHGADIPEFLPFKPSKTSFEIKQGSKEELLFTWTSPAGVTVEKNYVLNADDYTLEATLRVINSTKGALTGAVSTEIQQTYEKTKSSYHYGPVREEKGKIKRQKFEPSEESGKGGDPRHGDATRWLGVESMYFISALIPAKVEGIMPKDSGFSWESGVTQDNTARVKATVAIGLKPQEKEEFNYTVYLGPKEYSRLSARASGLEESIEFGFFSFLAKPFLWALNFFERYIKNYGLSIIILTVIIKILFHPLTKHGLNSMKEMQKIQPQLAALKERHKNDKEKLNKELMDLYKRYKINPLGGCLPMVVQIPVFIALYETLSVAIELRHAPFFLWIYDLSAKDPYYVTPILMGITMFIQQKMTPTAMDPMQEKMMLFMPVIMTFLFLSFPSGLVLYWLTNNILSIAQQYHIYRQGKG